jgi:hypothetical protein
MCSRQCVGLRHVGGLAKPCQPMGSRECDGLRNVNGLAKNNAYFYKAKINIKRLDNFISNYILNVVREKEKVSQIKQTKHKTVR